MIYDIKKAGDRTYILNDSVSVTIPDGFEALEEMELEIQFDEKILTEQEAGEMAELFITQAMESFLADIAQVGLDKEEDND